MQVTESMLAAAIKVGVERGLLPKYDFVEESAAKWETVKLMLEAALNDADAPALNQGSKSGFSNISAASPRKASNNAD